MLMKLFVPKHTQVALQERYQSPLLSIYPLLPAFAENISQLSCGVPVAVLVLATRLGKDSILPCRMRQKGHQQLSGVDTVTLVIMWAKGMEKRLWFGGEWNSHG